jgi:hypothetical protein
MYRTKVLGIIQKHGINISLHKLAQKTDNIFKRIFSPKGKFFPYKELLITIFFKELSSDGTESTLWPIVVCKFTAQYITGTQK